jgi:phosphate transport system substrate-binding protein
VITREEGSGTRASFEQDVMTGDANEPLPFAGDALVQDSNGAVRELVASDRWAIGYISIGLVDARVRALALDNVVPSDSTIMNGTYPLTRKFLFLTKTGKGRGKGRDSSSSSISISTSTFSSSCDSAGQAFINFVLSPEGQQVLSEEGLVKIQ